MAVNGLTRSELLQVQGWLTGVLWDIRHGYSPHAASTLIKMLKGIQIRSGNIDLRAFEGWPAEAVDKIEPYVFQ